MEETKDEIMTNDVLTERLQNTTGSTEAKNILFKILQLQQNMNVPLMEIEKQIDQLMAKLPEEMQQEATVLWNKLCPDNVYSPCTPYFSRK